jgi:hypothetical protein
MFGIGPYSFSPFKVAISGLHKAFRFQPVAPRNNRPVLFDDTCYFTACETAEEAALLSALLNSDDCLAFLGAVSFSDAKRPITKRLLQRIDLDALRKRLGRQRLLELAEPTLRQLTPGESAPLDRLADTLDNHWNV